MSETEEKSHSASARKLRKQRDEGSIPQGMEIAGYVSAAVGIAVASALLSTVPDRVSRLLQAALNIVDAPPGVPIFPLVRDALVLELLMLVAPVIGVVLAASIVTMLIWNRGLVFAMKPVLPQLSRVSPKSGLQRIYGRRGWTETGIGALRLAIWLLAAFAIAWNVLPRLFRNPGCGLSCQWIVLEPLPFALAAAAIACLLLAAGFEMLVQRSLFMHEQRMTDSEVKREQKDQHGQKEVRAERKRVRAELLAGMASAGVQRSNMAFYHGDRAIALRFDRGDTPIPCLSGRAEGEASVAALSQSVVERGFAVRESAEIVQACYSLEIGGTVPKTIFPALIVEIRSMPNVG